MGAKLDWLDDEEFYEICQTYRHARDILRVAPNFPTASEAFEALKQYIRDQVKKEM